MIPNIKNYLYKMKEWGKRIYVYPVDFINSDKKLDYDIYWKKKRDSGNLGALGAWQKKRAELALKIISSFSPVTVNDVGSGAGEVLKYISDNTKVSGANAYDISPYALDIAKGFGFNTTIFDIQNPSDISKISESDFTLLFEVLEHVSNAELLLKKSLEKSSKGVLFSFPNTGFFIHRLRILLGKFPLQWTYHPGEHLRFWTKRDLIWWLKAQGYSNYEIYYYVGVPILKDIWPSMFAAGFFVYIKR